MKPIEFAEQNTLATSPEPNIEPLPCCLLDGQVISCWELTPEEIDRIKETGKIYVSQLSGKGIIPIFLTTDKHDLFIYPNSDPKEEEVSEKKIICKFLELRNPYPILREMGYKLKQELSFPENIKNFIEMVREENRMNELWNKINK